MVLLEMLKELNALEQKIKALETSLNGLKTFLVESLQKKANAIYDLETARLSNSALVAKQAELEAEVSLLKRNLKSKPERVAQSAKKRKLESPHSAGGSRKSLDTRDARPATVTTNGFQELSEEKVRGMGQALFVQVFNKEPTRPPTNMLCLSLPKRNPNSEMYEVRKVCGMFPSKGNRRNLVLRCPHRDDNMPYGVDNARCKSCGGSLHHHEQVTLSSVQKANDKIWGCNASQN